MLGKHRRIRHGSRKRAIRAAQARAARRHSAESVSNGPSSVTEQDHTETDSPPAPEWELETDTPVSAEPAPHDSAASLAWTGLVLLTVVLGGFMAAVIFMLG